MINPLALFLDTLRPCGGLHAAAREGEVKHITWLLDNNIYKVDCYYKNRTALYQATISNQPASILNLLKYKADPNLPSKTSVYLKQEKPIQNCIDLPNVSNIKLLIMHGTTADGVRFMLNRQDIKNLLLQTFQAKQQYDFDLKEAETQLSNKEYPQALTNYLKAGEVWHGLSQGEPVSIYQCHYQEQALSFYKKAIDCYEKLSASELTDKLKGDCQHLFERAADCCQLLNLANEAKVYSSKSATLHPDLRRQAYSNNLEDLKPKQITDNGLGLYWRKSIKSKQREEQQPLLDLRDYGNPKL